MPRRRKNRRNHKGPTRKLANVNKENSIELIPNDVMRACFDDDSLNKSKPISPLEVVTPLRIPNPYINDTLPFEENVSSIRTTPVNRKRSFTRPERQKFNSMNVTNLNFLFDSNFFHNSSRPESDVCKNESNISYRKRSNSSIPKLHSPFTDTAVLVCEGKKTNVSSVEDTSKLEYRTCEELLETPKMSRMLLRENLTSGQTDNVSTSNNKSIDKINKRNRNIKYNGEVNLNPYLNKEINIGNKEGSFGEISFFSPNLFEHKSSSTPIEKLQQANDLVEYLKDSLRKESINNCSVLSGKLDLQNNLDLSEVSKLETNVNLNKTPLAEKSLSSMCNLYNDDISMLDSPEAPVCKCEEYREEISNLNQKIEGLTEEVRVVKSQLEVEKLNKDNIELLTQELNKVREELSQFKELRTELESLKEQFKCLKSAPATTSTLAPPPPPPPPLPCLPPPPPPPLPPLPSSSSGYNPLRLSKKIKTKTNCDDNSRPVISLDDILKVKLKKTSDRSNCITPTSRRHSQPVVSMDMLRQVKLRPASRPSSFRPDTPDTEASSSSTSPHSSLCRRNLAGNRDRDGS